MSRVSISSSGRAARLDRLAFCAAVRGGNVSKVYLTVFLLITSSLYWRRLSGGNDPHNFGTLLIPQRVRNQKQWAILNQAERLPPLFAAFDAVLYGYVQRVSKYLAGFFKAHALLSLKCLPTARSAHPDPPLFRAKPTASSRSARSQQTRNGLFCAVSRWVHASETKYAGSRISETYLCASCARRTLSEDATEETGGNTNTEASAARQPVSEYAQLASHSLHFPPFCLLFTRGSCWFLRARAGSCGRMSAQRAAGL